MKYILTFVFMISVSYAFAVIEKVNGIEWTYYVKDGNAVLGDYSVRTNVAAKIVWTNYFNTISKKTGGTVAIPNTLGGYRVVEIGNEAFSSCADLTEVVLGNYITNIAASAFSKCSSLTDIKLNDGLQSIQTNAFGLCSSLINVEFPETLDYLDFTAFDTVEYFKYNGAPYKNIGCGLHFAFFKGNRPQSRYDFLFNYGPVWNDELGSTRQKPVVLMVAGRTGWGDYNSELMPCTARVEQLTEHGLSSSRQIVSPGEIVTLASTNKIVYVPWNSSVSQQGKVPTRIYYTTDGSEPTTNSTLYTKGIIIDHATTIKASIDRTNFNSSDSSVGTGQVPRAQYPSWYAKFNYSFLGTYKNSGYGTYDLYHTSYDLNYGTTETCEYAFGQTVDPLIASSQGSTFYYSGNMVALECETDGAEIRYTLDGQEPTKNSKLYTGPFTIDGTTTVKARAYKTDWFESEVVTAIFTRKWHTVDAPVIEPDGCEFDNASQEVNISCATDGATIYYTIDGSDPATNGKEYRHSFTVYNSCTVRAVAIKDDWRNSEIAEALFARGEELSAAANFYGYKLETGDDAWSVDGEVSHDGVSSIKSNGSGSYVQGSVRGAGTLSFWWRAMCEEPEEGDYYDYGVFKVGESCAAYIAGNDTGWQFFSTNITTTSKHLLRWEYQKDEEGSFAPDCVWVDQVQWVPANGSGFTMTTPEPVPYSWFPLYNFANYDDLEALGNAPSGKIQGGRQTCIWEEYVAGTDPTDENDIFKATITFDTAGEPVISWTPKFDDPDEEEKRIYRKFGKVKLNDNEWTEIQDGEEDNYNFFKVTDEMR